MKDLNKALTYIVYVGQLGLDLIMPVLLCLLLAWLLDGRFSLGVWIYFVAFFFGLGAGACTFWKFYTKVVMKGEKKANKSKDKIHSYSKHI